MITNHRELSNEKFLSLMGDGTIDPKLFNHEAHVRLAWLYLTRDGMESALASISKAIRQLDDQYTNGMKYHHTITVSFSLIILLLIRGNKSDSWDEFIAEHEPLTYSKALLSEYYNESTLYNDHARKVFVPPDKNPGAEFSRLVSHCEGVI
jgi:hypothetical protein